MRRFVGLMVALTVSFPLMATHNRAGEITCRQISDFTYEITLTTFTYTLSAADRPQLEVQWGDNTTSIANRQSIVYLPNFYKRNTYIVRHTYPGPGVYQIVVQDPNRNFGVKNIPNSVNVIFSVQTTLLINPKIGKNSTPVLLNPPIDKAALGHIFIHNPSAFDPDGDSLSYELTVCRKEKGEPIENYTFPEASDTLYVDPVTGDLVWDSPVDSGIYNLAMNIYEWRDGIRIGNIERDMQVEVYNTDNNPPVNPDFKDYCIMAGDSVQFEFTVTDPDFDSVHVEASGGMFFIDSSRVTFTRLAADTGFSTYAFSWVTECEDARQQPYQVVIKSEDDNADLKMVTISNFHIRVLGPPPENLDVIPGGNSMRLTWSPGPCDSIPGYRIYRKMGFSGYQPDSCASGVPAFTGYVAVGQTKGDTVYIDNNNGQGLMQGTDYCYMVVGLYRDGSESVPSNEDCGILVNGTPVITNVSVTQTGVSDGRIFLSWMKPRSLDTIPANGPYEYLIYRSPGLWGKNYTLIHTFKTADLNDTTYTDTLINTRDVSYTYKVELYNDVPGNRFLIGDPGVASSLFVFPEPNDNRVTLHIRKNVPWINTGYTIYRQNKVSGLFDSIGFTSDTLFTDTGLTNGVNYCYFVESSGSYNRPGFPEPILNHSQIACAVPVDLTPPCPPELHVTSVCDSLYNALVWNNPNNSCTDDVVAYRLYYKNFLKDPFQELAYLSSPEDTTYIHFPENSLSGCYAITAVDSFDNVSPYSPIVCVDSCTFYEIPNVFTPNGDNINDLLKARVIKFVEKVDMQIFNRNGKLVYRTQDPEINWNGKYMGNKQLVPPGVYYYLCDVYETRLTGVEVRNISGFIHVITEKGAVNPGEK
ncbi:MAG: gliding motility-associated C-terminal domain-containing protein [Chlorobi bacterium]|nr:gliding motility-associated C-terminal domain-containing protein [Chlorobiota bacterium]